MREINYKHRDSMKGFPVLHKNGAVTMTDGECTPFVYKGRLMCLENHWEGFGGLPGPCAAIFDYFSRETYTPVGGDGTRFYSAYCENDRVYVYGTKANCIYCYDSDDLHSWRKTLVLEMPEMFDLFNTSVCKGDGKYVMAIEGAWAGQSTGDQQNKVGNPYIGEYYTEFFAESYDLFHWTNLPFEKSYTTERYCACPALRYCDGYYYMICLERLPGVRYAPYMYRTADFETWEMGLYNPLFIPSEEDRKIKEGVELPEDLVRANAYHVDINNSDVDLCEFEGKTYMLYATGHQGGAGGMNGLNCEITYDGTLEQYLKANFE